MAVFTRGLVMDRWSASDWRSTAAAYGVLPSLGRRFCLALLCLGLLVHFVTTGRWHDMPLDRAPSDYAVAAVGAIIVGFLEEFVFRGLVMGALWRRHGYWIANVISALLFVVIHWPGWIVLGHLPTISIITISANVLVFGIVMELLSGLEGGIRLASAFHVLNDLLIGAVFR